MLKIRAEQLQRMSRTCEDLFVQEMILHLSQTFPKELGKTNLAPEELHAFVADGISQARHYGITSRAGIRQYLDCAAVLGPGFAESEDHPWARALLCDDNLSSQEKAEGLAWHMLSEVNWEDREDV